MPNLHRMNSKGIPKTKHFIKFGIESDGHHSLGLHTGQGGLQYRWLSTEPIPNGMVWSQLRNADEKEEQNVKKKNDNNFTDNDGEKISRRVGSILRPKLVHQKLQDLFQTYDFLMVSERLDESNVALALLMGLNVSTVFPPSSAKTSGDYSLIRNREKNEHLFHTCRYSQKYDVPDAVTTYLTSPRYLAKTCADQLIYRAANMSLDLTIDCLGRHNRFDRALTEYRRLKQEAQHRCGERLGSGCTANGTVVQPIEACYDNDFGCGYQCVDKVALELEQEESRRRS